MSYVEEHVFADTAFEIPLTDVGDDRHELVVDLSGTFNIRFPGRLFIFREARFLVRSEPLPENPGGGRPPGNPRPIITSTPIALNLVITAPDGRPFTKDEVTLADLRRYRDLRGESRGRWSYRLWGRSGKYVSTPNSPVKAFPGNGHLKILVQERVASKSAPPLVYEEIPAGGGKRFTFDLYRVGTFVATAQPPRLMKLMDPNGTTVATSDTGELRFPVALPTIDLSRDAAGKPRLWSLDLREGSPTPGAPTAVWASVVDTARVRTELVKRRLDVLLGEGGANIELYGKDREDFVDLCIKIKDEVAAGTFDMFGVLDHVLPPGAKHLEPNTEYVLGSFDRHITAGAAGLEVTLAVSVAEMTLDRLDISFGPSERLQQPSPLAPPIGPPLPSIKVGISVSGEGAIKKGGLTVATIRVRGLELEAGLGLKDDGTLEPAVWTSQKPLDVDISFTAAIAAGAVSPALAGVAAQRIESKESDYNEKIADGVKDFFTGLLKRAPRFFAVLLGEAFSYTSFRPEGDEFVLDYVAPVEHEPKPNRDYKGIIGRSVTSLGPNAHLIRPRTLGDTWAADNLVAKIDHIFVVMMENRSFDHVLGYLAAQPSAQDSDGLSTGLVDFIQGFGWKVRPLRETNIAENGVHLKTELREHVGHGLADVREQIGKTLTTPDPRAILSPEGFVSNFQKHRDPQSAIELTDVLGYYTNDDDPRTSAPAAKDLPFFDFLVKHYAWSERYFCSHAGPTLPNRMFSLPGDVQYDRTGEAILDNNKSDNFFLSRAQTIFDVLTRKGVSWRVYESAPSVAMLRMFARYATDDTDIVAYTAERLRDDVVNGDVPSVVFIEPAMHHFPQSDDHPPADMYRGQLFLKDVYDALTANDEVWRKSMLIITYDEHGGFYDHVIPPIAEIRARRPDANTGRGGSAVQPAADGAGSGTSGDSGTGSGTGPTGDGGRGPGRRFEIVRELADAVRAGARDLPGEVVVGPLGRGPRGEVGGPAGEVFEGEPGPTLTPIEGQQSLTTHYGVRVPTFVVSPWVTPGKGPDVVLDHCSILKTILARFLGEQKPFMSDRVHTSRSFESFLTADEPRLGLASPDLPRLEDVDDHASRRAAADPIITKAVFREQMRRGNVDYHDLTGMIARIIGPARE